MCGRRCKIDTDQELFFEFSTLYNVLDRTLNKHLNRHLNQLGITTAQARILAYLFAEDEAGHEVNQKSIETAFMLTNPTVTGILKRLEGKGYITRQASKTDARRNVILLTDRSRSERSEMALCTQEMRERIVSGLSAHEVELLSGAIAKILANISDL